MCCVLCRACHCMWEQFSAKQQTFIFSVFTKYVGGIDLKKISRKVFKLNFLVKQCRTKKNGYMKT